MNTDYTELITSEHDDKPNFLATVSLLAGAVGGTVDAIASLPQKFDLDVAVGDQLDKVGLWVGASRKLTVPLNIYFSWDTAGRGWNEANWKGPNDATTGIVNLDDQTFRLLIRSLIAADHWDGTTTSYQQLMTAVLQPYGNVMYCVDNQNMTMGIVVQGPPISLALQTIIQNGVFGLKPVGVALSSFAFPTSGGGAISGAAKDFANATGKLT